MLIYLIIAAELAILYTVFWYVFVRDPKPYKISGPLWGKYDDGDVSPTSEPLVPFVISVSENAPHWTARTPDDAFRTAAGYNAPGKISRINKLLYRRNNMSKKPASNHTDYWLASSLSDNQSFMAALSRLFGF